jgi:hypothetical protein
MQIDYLLGQSEHGVRIGYSQEAGWIAAWDGEFTILKGKNVWRAAPLLEFAPEAVVERIAGGNALAPTAVSFPLTDLLRLAFVGGSSYWAEKAARWYPFLDEDEKHELATTLSDLAIAKWAGQQLRQFAKREVSRSNASR